MVTNRIPCTCWCWSRGWPWRCSLRQRGRRAARGHSRQNQGTGCRQRCTSPFLCDQGCSFPQGLSSHQWWLERTWGDKQKGGLVQTSVWPWITHRCTDRDTGRGLSECLQESLQGLKTKMQKLMSVVLLLMGTARLAKACKCQEKILGQLLKTRKNSQSKALSHYHCICSQGIPPCLPTADSEPFFREGALLHPFFHSIYLFSGGHTGISQTWHIENTQ